VLEVKGLSLRVGGARSDCLSLPSLHSCLPVTAYYKLPNLTLSLYITLKMAPYSYQIYLSEMVGRGSSNPGAISSSVSKERQFESG
jgi:hypothetical protein